MEIRQLRYFVGISNAGSFTKASAALAVAQSALSRQMAAVEVELGVRLFERYSGGVALTDAGRVFFPHALTILAEVERARYTLTVKCSNFAPKK